MDYKSKAVLECIDKEIDNSTEALIRDTIKLVRITVLRVSLCLSLLSPLICKMDVGQLH